MKISACLNHVCLHKGGADKDLFSHISTTFSIRIFWVTKEFISKAPSPSPSPSRGEGCNIPPPLRGGDEGEGDVCGFTNDLISNHHF